MKLKKNSNDKYEIKPDDNFDTTKEQKRSAIIVEDWEL